MQCCAERRGALLSEVRPAQAAAGAPLPRLPAVRAAHGAPVCQPPRIRDMRTTRCCERCRRQPARHVAGWLAPTYQVLPVRASLAKHSSPHRIGLGFHKQALALTTLELERMAAALSDDLVPGNSSAPKPKKLTLQSTQQPRRDLCSAFISVRRPIHGVRWRVPAQVQQLAALTAVQRPLRRTTTVRG